MGAPRTGRFRGGPGPSLRQSLSSLLSCGFQMKYNGIAKAIALTTIATRISRKIRSVFSATSSFTAPSSADSLLSSVARAGRTMSRRAKAVAATWVVVYAVAFALNYWIEFFSFGSLLLITLFFRWDLRRGE